MIAVRASFSLSGQEQAIGSGNVWTFAPLRALLIQTEWRASADALVFSTMQFEKKAIKLRYMVSLFSSRNKVVACWRQARRNESGGANKRSDKSWALLRQACSTGRMIDSLDCTAR